VHEQFSVVEPQDCEQEVVPATQAVLSQVEQPVPVQLSEPEQEYVPGEPVQVLLTGPTAMHTVPNPDRVYQAQP